VPVQPELKRTILVPISPERQVFCYAARFPAPAAIAAQTKADMDAVSDNLIEIHDLDYSFGARKIFNGLNLTVKQGQITAIMGPSGTGKTTLLRTL
jgi:ABC-type transport system involved in cytochrome bd biosynthesis fused ATPase/permease subunit